MTVPPQLADGLGASPSTSRPPFSATALIEASTALRSVGRSAASIEEVAGEVVTLLREHFLDKEKGASALPLVRFYVTRRYDDLDPQLQDVARAAGPDGFAERNAVCLALLATSGEEPRWNDRRLSSNHRAIPLPSVAALDRLPMVAALVRQIGLDPERVVNPQPFEADVLPTASDVFFVERALDSPTIPDQDAFVVPYGIRSAAGFGGILPDGLAYAVVMFSSVAIPADAISSFPVLALSLECALLPRCGSPVFARSAPGTPIDPTTLDRRRAAVLERLLDTRAGVITSEAARLERVAAEADGRARDLTVSRAELDANRAHLQSIIDGALDAIVAMDADGRITDFNRAAEELFGHSREHAVGQLLGELIIPYRMRSRHADGLRQYLRTGEGPVIGRRIEVPALRADETEFPVELAVTRVSGVEPAIFIGYIRDMSAVRQAGEEVAAARERLAHLARTLQANLLPPELPRLEGFELAALYRPFGDAYDVGGDFYDIFEIGDGRWVAVLGDVCGKGPEAAAVTAIGRYTIRAAAIQEDDPAAVLKIANDAIHRQSPERFCTVAIITFDRDGNCRVALGGHPHPIAVNASSDTRSIGMPGLLLGPFEEWHSEAESFVLEPGASLVLFSDGVFEARRGVEQFGEDRLASAISAAPGSARAIVASVEHAVESFMVEATDDIAVLVIRRVGDDA